MNRFPARIGVIAAVLVLAAACGGEDSSSKEATRTGGTSLGTAEGTERGAATAAAAASPAASAAARASDIARAVATAQATARAQAQASGADPCRVATKEELEAALGFPLGPGERKPGPIGDEQCVYRARSDQTPGTMPDVTVAIYESRLARTTYDGLRESASPRTTDVPGLGEKAYVFIGSRMPDSRELRVLQGDMLLSIDVTAILNPAVNMSDEEKRTKLIVLARTALGRL